MQHGWVSKQASLHLCLLPPGPSSRAPSALTSKKAGKHAGSPFWSLLHSVHFLYDSGM